MKLKITITGKVHDVGYRPFLFSTAMYFGISHFNARNVFIENKQVVEVLVGGDEDRVKKFVEYVKSEKPPLAVVEKIEVEDYADEILPIDDFRKVLNSEQLNKIIQVGLVMLQKQDMMLEKQDMMLQKQDKTIEAIHETKTHLGEKIDLLRVDLKSYMDERFSKMEEEIKKIKAKIGME